MENHISENLSQKKGFLLAQITNMFGMIRMLANQRLVAALWGCNCE